MIDRFEQFTSVISSIYRYIQKIEREEMEKYGLKGAFAQYLLAIGHYPHGITAAALCETCDKDKAAVSRIVAEMETKGLIRRISSGDNQYRARLTLTEAGRRAAQFVRERAEIAVELAGQGLSDQDRKIFYSALELIAGNIHSMCAKGIPEAKV